MSEPVQVYTACQFVRLQKKLFLLLDLDQIWFKCAVVLKKNQNNFEIENKNVAITHFYIEFIEENDII